MKLFYVFFLVALVMGTFAEDVCKDRASKTRCDQRKAAGWCDGDEDRQSIMRNQCRKTCGYCS
ncbi:unnamed protein product [Nippostrongylus brasiliensis]|uniref:ShKT domain-containing protein n=1 Tax=Nippostrongylus brasiliensis TaxID=27835 RepID=A0A0N4Y242_NIPBR|nr:unnamed protein product [Nippostrongylus brasiliensis]